MKFWVNFQSLIQNDDSIENNKQLFNIDNCIKFNNYKDCICVNDNGIIQIRWENGNQNLFAHPFITLIFKIEHKRNIVTLNELGSQNNNESSALNITNNNIQLSPNSDNKKNHTLSSDYDDDEEAFGEEGALGKQEFLSNHDRNNLNEPIIKNEPALNNFNDSQSCSFTKEVS